MGTKLCHMNDSEPCEHGCTTWCQRVPIVATLTVRLDADDRRRLDEVATANGCTDEQALRMGIDALHAAGVAS